MAAFLARGIRCAWGAALLFALLAAPAHAQTITVTKLRDLDFGLCDNVGGSTFTVDAAATQPGTGCAGAQSAEFTVTVSPITQKMRINVPNNVSIANGGEMLTVNFSASVGNGPVCLPGGSLTVYVGGSVKLPPAGVTTAGLFIASSQIEATTAGGKC